MMLFNCPQIVNALLCECNPSQAILCINRTKKSIHVRIYKLTRIWSIKNIPVLATEERSTTINYTSRENAVLSLCSRI